MSFTVLSGWSVPGSQSSQRGILAGCDRVALGILGGSGVDGGLAVA